MQSLLFIAALALPSLCLVSAQAISSVPNVPEGYQVGFATQDNEPTGQQSICNTNCQLTNPFSTTAGPTPLAPGVYAAAAPPGIGGASDDCSPCGTCYHLISSGAPYCSAWPYDPGCGTPSGPNVQEGPTDIKIVITNHCQDCDEVPGHFDINQAPAGWDNPRIYWQRLDDAACY